MKSEFSEFSYGFALTHGLLKDTPSIDVAPHFPSLVEEGKGGFDVEVGFPGIPIYLQFKLSDYLTRRPAKYWDYYHEPYFRFDITPLTVSQQHNLLKDLADSGEEVFYVSPLFWKTTQFNEAFRDNQVAARSMWLPLRRLRHLDDYEPHHVTFTGTADPSWHTDERNLEGERMEGDFSWQGRYESIEDRIERGELRQVSEDYLYELRDLLSGIVTRRASEISDNSGRQVQAANILGEIDYLLTTCFGVEMVVLRPVPPSSDEEHSGDLTPTT